MNVPKLRFGEFREEWTTGTLGELSDVRDGTHESPKFYEKGYPLVTSKNLQQDGTLDLTNVSYICHEDYEHFNQRSKVEKGDIVFGMIGTIGNPVLLKNENFAIKNVALIKEKHSLKNIFLINYLRSPNIEKQFHFANVGGTQKFIALGQIRKLAIRFPSLIEQQKIADFLSAVDEKITALTAQKTALTQYKQGMMQRIFAQTLRFKDDNGADYPEWEEYMIGDVFKVTRGQVLASSETSETVNSNYIYPVYSSQTKNNGLMGYFNDYLYQDAITWTTDGANAGDVNFRSGRFYCTNVCGVLISENGFANQCVSEILNKITHRYVSYVGNPKLMNNVMSNIVINLPSSIEEQTKIAQFLTECDDKINAVDAQILSAQQWKQGLLQQMFV